MKQTDNHLRPPEPAGYQAPAVHKAFQILRAVAASPARLGLSELAVELGFSKSTTHGLVHALVREGALAQSAQDKKMFLGATIVDLAFTGWNYPKITRCVQPLLDDLRDTIGETVFLGVLNRSNVRAVIMATAEATKPLKISSPPGTAISLFAGAVGKVFLAGMGDALALSLIEENGLPRFTEHSIGDTADYIRELDQVRRQGYALDNEEYLPGVKAVAVGLGNLQGLPLAVWVVGFASAMDEAVMPEIVSATIESAYRLNGVLEEGI
jgi:DNA-binding IclR family transcriptional regulator